MGNGMDKVLTGLYVGSLKDSKDREQLEKNEITHILSIHDEAKEGRVDNVKYKIIRAADCATQDLQQYFHDCIEFIHTARLEGGNVLVHCLAGVSRSTTIVIAYVMTVTELSWVDAMNAVRGARKITNPNFGFQRQLQSYEHLKLSTEKSNLVQKNGSLNDEDTKFAKDLLKVYNERQELHLTEQKQTQKTYPLPFNAYNLDSNMLKKFNKKNEEERKPTEQLEAEGDKTEFKELETEFNHLEIETPEELKEHSKVDIDHKINKFFETKKFQ